MKITLEIFANRLRKFLECESVCQRCPLTLGFKFQSKDVFGHRLAPKNVVWSSFQVSRAPSCTICQEFVGGEGVQQGCPCSVLGHDEAIAAAHTALALWDKGEHPMQEGGRG